MGGDPYFRSCCCPRRPVHIVQKLSKELPGSRMSDSFAEQAHPPVHGSTTEGTLQWSGMDAAVARDHSRTYEQTMWSVERLLFHVSFFPFVSFCFFCFFQFEMLFSWSNWSYISQFALTDPVPCSLHFCWFEILVPFEYAVILWIKSRYHLLINT